MKNHATMISRGPGHGIRDCIASGIGVNRRSLNRREYETGLKLFTNDNEAGGAKKIFHSLVHITDEWKTGEFEKTERWYKVNGLFFYVQPARFCCHHSFFGKFIKRVAELP